MGRRTKGSISLVFICFVTLLFSGCAIPKSILNAENSAFTKMNEIATEADTVIRDLVVQYRTLSHLKIEVEVGKLELDEEATKVEIEKRKKAFEEELSKITKKLISLKEKWDSVFAFRKKVIDYLEEHKE